MIFFEIVTVLDYGSGSFSSCGKLVCLRELLFLRLLDCILLRNLLSVLLIDHSKAQTVMTHSVYACGSAYVQVRGRRQLQGSGKDAGNSQLQGRDSK